MTVEFRDADRNDVTQIVKLLEAETPAVSRMSPITMINNERNQKGTGFTIHTRGRRNTASL